MAKNFTDFQEIAGDYTPPSPVDGVTPGTTNTQATTDMYLVGYETDEPHGERRYTIESVLLAADKYHVGLENVTNESKQYMFKDSRLTGETKADNLVIYGDLTVEGTQVTLNTTIAATSAIKIKNYGTNPALEVVQTGTDDVVNFYHTDTDLAFNINQHGRVGINTIAPESSMSVSNNDDPVGIQMHVNGSTLISGDIYTTGAVDGVYLNQLQLKSDDIQNRADVTSLNLSNVSQRLTELQQTTEYSNIDIAKGFDLLEDGDDYKKIPLNPEQGTAVSDDYSVAKLKSVEYDADKTADHSADLTYNHIPDGPWTGDQTNSFVKMTSAQSVRIDNVRGVDRFLTGVEDTGEDITAAHIVQAYQSQYPSFWSTEDENEYRNIILPKLNSARTTTNTYSADWQSVATQVHSLSDSWEESVDITAVDDRVDAIITTVGPVSGDWNSTHTTVYNTSGDWNSTRTTVYNTSSDWESTRSSVHGTSGDWNSARTTVYNTSAEWTASVNNKLNDDGTQQSLPAGKAELEYVNISESLTAQSDVRLGGSVFILSAGKWKQGVTDDIPLGEDVLRFVDGILVDWIK